MKRNHYIVTFTNGKTVRASGFNTEEAEILAKAVMIKMGFTYTVESVVKVNFVNELAHVDYAA